jgi:hypothetical protein
MRRRAAVLALACVLLAGALAACGARPQATTVEQLPTGPLSRQQYIHAFEVSANGLAQRYGVETDPKGGGSAERQDRRLAALQRLLRAWGDRLAGLQPPAEATRAHARFVAGVREFAGDLDRARALLRRGDVKGADRLFQTGRILSARTRGDLVAGRRAFHALHYDINNLDKSPVETPEAGS